MRVKRLYEASENWDSLLDTVLDGIKKYESLDAEDQDAELTESVLDEETFNKEKFELEKKLLGKA